MSNLSNLYIEIIDMKSGLELSKKLEGLPRHTSTHAAGIINDQPYIIMHH